MLGRRHGNRSAVTCHLKCDSACAHPAPNTSTEPNFAEIAARQFSRRSLLVASGSLAAAAALPTFLAGCTPRERKSSTAPSEGLDFDPIDPVPEKVDAITVPYGYRWTPILRWGDPLLADSPDFAPGFFQRSCAGTPVRRLCSRAAPVRLHRGNWPTRSAIHSGQAHGTRAIHPRRRKRTRR
jgi:hypothetical protein